MLATAVGPACTQLSSEVLSRVSETLSSPSGRVRTAGRKVPGPVHQEAGAGSPRTTHAHRPATGRPHPEPPFPVPGIHETAREGVGGLQVPCGATCTVGPFLSDPETRL